MFWLGCSVAGRQLRMPAVKCHQADQFAKKRQDFVNKSLVGADGVC
jgi:hypothetical protein